MTPNEPPTHLMGRVSRIAHLTARMADVLLSRRLTPAEQAEVAGLLASPAEQAMFWGQPRADQRHGLAAARSAAEARPGRAELIRAALLHDIGKRHARLGAVGRAWAVVGSAMGLPPSVRAADYLDHGRLAGEELAAGGAEPLVVSYALHHHGRCPEEVSPVDWEVLAAADRARFPSIPPIRRRRQRPRPSRRSTYDRRPTYDVVSPAGEARSHDL